MNKLIGTLTVITLIAFLIVNGIKLALILGWMKDCDCKGNAEDADAPADTTDPDATDPDVT